MRWNRGPVDPERTVGLHLSVNEASTLRRWLTDQLAAYGQAFLDDAQALDQPARELDDREQWERDEDLAIAAADLAFVADLVADLSRTVADITRPEDDGESPEDAHGVGYSAP